jgi:hypothetical protein
VREIEVIVCMECDGWIRWMEGTVCDGMYGVGWMRCMGWINRMDGIGWMDGLDEWIRWLDCMHRLDERIRLLDFMGGLDALNVCIGWDRLDGWIG